MTMRRCAINLTRLAAVALLASGTSHVAGKVVTFDGQAPVPISNAPRPAVSKHVSHLVHSVPPYFKDVPGFEGISFRPKVTAGASPADSVEFLFPVAELRRYETYGVTGQQWINEEFVLLNGERIGLDLQTVETVKRIVQFKDQEAVWK